MTLLLTEIHCFGGIDQGCIVFAADRRISKLKGGKYVYHNTQKKTFEIPYLHAAIGYYGLAEIPPYNMAMSDWLRRFIRRNTTINDLGTFSTTLADVLNRDVPEISRKSEVSGFHIAGYNSSGFPEFWFVRNVKDDRRTILGKYKVREDFLRRDAKRLGYDGRSFIHTYRNGDIRAHVTAWKEIDKGFRGLLQQPEFKEPVGTSGYQDWAKFKMEVISYFYKQFCKESIVAKPIDTILIKSSRA